jgi:hypothetical protein
MWHPMLASINEAELWPVSRAGGTSHFSAADSHAGSTRKRLARDDGTLARAPMDAVVPLVLSRFGCHHEGSWPTDVRGPNGGRCCGWSG